MPATSHRSWRSHPMSPTKPCPNRVAPAAPRPGHAALRRGRVTLHNGVYFVTAATHQRIALFRDCCAARTAARSFEDPLVLGDASMLAWVLMPDHAHWLIQLGATTPLGVCIGRIKSASSREVNRACRRKGASGRRHSTITRCAPRRMSRWPRATSWPIPCGRGWWNASAIIRTGTRYGSERLLSRAWPAPTAGSGASRGGRVNSISFRAPCTPWRRHASATSPLPSLRGRINEHALGHPRAIAGHSAIAADRQA